VIEPRRSHQTKSMVRVLTQMRALELALGAGFLVAATAAGCAGKALDVGSEEQPGVSGSGIGGSGPSRPRSPNQPTTLSEEDLANVQWPADTPCTPTPGSMREGTWKGHWPDSLSSTNADVVVRIKGRTPDGLPCGTVTIGEGEPPPPVTDSDAIYPPSQGMGGNSGLVGGVGPAITQPWPGYAYRMLKVQASETRLAFFITYQEILRPWCQLQPAVQGSFSCLPEWTNGGTATPPGECYISGPELPYEKVPCFKMQYCSSYTCFCYDGSCDVALSGTPFELHWDGASLEGSVNQTQLLFLDPVP